MNTTFPLSEKTFCLHFTKSCHSGKLYPVSEITFLHMNRTKLFDSSKCFLANRDNFCPYEQALSRQAGYATAFYCINYSFIILQWLKVVIYLKLFVGSLVIKRIIFSLSSNTLLCFRNYSSIFKTILSYNYYVT